MDWFLYDNGLRHERIKKYDQNRELFDHLFSKTYIDEYIDLDTEVVISLSAIGPLKIE